MDVSPLIFDANDRASALSAQAHSLLSSAMDHTGILTSIGRLPTINIDGTWDVTLPDAPRIDPVSMPAQRVAPVMPDLADISTPALVHIPDAPEIDITVTDPVRPAALRTFTESAPSVSITAQLPIAPAPFVREAPTLSDVSMPSTPQIQRYSFDGVRPVDDLSDAPDAATAFDNAWRSISPSMQAAIGADVDAFIAKYNPRYHSQMEALEKRLAAMVQGGTGLRPDVEDAIYERARAKNGAEARRVQDQAWDSAARRGFTLPTGALMAAQLAARQGAADNNAAASREIVVIAAELEQKNIQFAITTSAGLRQTILNAAVQMHGNLIQLNGQAIQYANAVVDAMVKVYELEVERFKVRLEQYRVDAQVFETLIRSSLADIELYKAQIDAERAKLQVDDSRVRLFQAQIDAHKAAVETWGKQVDGIVAMAQLERMKIDLFKAKVDAFQAEAGANADQWRAYSAAWGGEETKVRAQLGKVQVHQARIEGAKAQIAAGSAQVDAQAKVVQAKLSAFETESRAFGEQVRADVAIVQGKLGVQDSLIKAYQVGSQAAVAKASVGIESIRAQNQLKIAEFSAQTQAVMEEARLLVQSMSNYGRIAHGIGQTYASMAGAALAGMNTLVQASDQ